MDKHLKDYVAVEPKINLGGREYAYDIFFGMKSNSEDFICNS
jgi:hypothetical protein